jgi:hypothetical protein
MRGIGWRLGLAVVVIGGVGAAEPAVVQATTFSYTGGEQTYTVPAGVSEVSITAIGAPGGAARGAPLPDPQAGRGAVVSGVVNVTAGQTVYVEVGGPGGMPTGGFNGGGDAGTLFAGHSWLGGGGGASDVRTLPMSAGQISLNSRVIVAAGGGGSGGLYAAGGDAGQPGGGSSSSSVGGGAGTQTAGGAGGCDALATGCGMAGSLGTGGAGGSSSATVYADVGAGGGGGLYGGGGGAGVNGGVGGVGVDGEDGGGGGGSSLVPSVLGTMSLASLTTAPAVEIMPVPPPTCADVATSTPYRQAVTVQLKCTEFAARALTYAIVTAPAHGRLGGDVASGQVTYTPAAGFSGEDSFTYDASSTNGHASAVTVSIAVAPRSVARAGHAHASRTGVKIQVRCSVDGVGTGPDCNMTVTMSTKVVTVGRATVVVGAGDTQIINIPLNRKGKDLLAARGKLPVSVVVTQTVSGTKSVVSRQRLVL